MLSISSTLIWAHSLGAQTGIPVSETLWICHWGVKQETKVQLQVMNNFITSNFI